MYVQCLGVNLIERYNPLKKKNLNFNTLKKKQGKQRMIPLWTDTFLNLVFCCIRVSEW